MTKRMYQNIAAVLLLILVAWGAIRIFQHFIDPKQVLTLLQNVPWYVMVLVLILSSSMMITRAFRFFILLRDAQIRVSFWQTLKVYLAGQALTPLPGGEGSRTIFLKLETHTSVKNMVTPLIMLGISEMLVAVTIALVGGIFFGLLRAAAFAALVGTVALLWLLTNHKAVQTLWDKLPGHPKVQKAGKAITSTQKEVHSNIFKSNSHYPSPLFLKNLGLAFLTDILGGLIIFTLMRSLHIHFGLLRSVYVFAAATVLGELVQFIPGGVGVTEGGLTGILILSGVALPPASAVVLLFRAATLVYGILVGILFLCTFYIKRYMTKGFVKG